MYREKHDVPFRDNINNALLLMRHTKLMKKVHKEYIL